MLILKNKICVVCNKQFTHPRNHHAVNTCSQNCRNVRKKERKLKFDSLNKEQNYIKRRKWKKDNPEQTSFLERKSYLKRTYGITILQYNEMLDNQNGVCAICKNKETTYHAQTKKVKSLAVDHCHNTGKVRGLLCYECNTSIGKMKEDVIILQNAIEYLKAHK